VTLSVPFPSTSGGRKRDAEIIRRLSDRAEIHLAVITSSFERDVAAASDALEFCESVAVTPQGDETPDDCPEGVRAFASRRLNSHLLMRHQVRPFDLIHVEGYYLASVAAALPQVPLVLTVENIESDVDLQLAAVGCRRSEWSRTRQYETAVWRRAEAVAVLTTQDSERMRELAPGMQPVVCPNGIDPFVGDSPASAAEDRAVLGFLGNYSYTPTEDAAFYLYKEVWPEVSRAVPAARILFCGAGRREPRVARLVGGDPRAAFMGAVADVSEFFDAVDVFVAPIRAGGGVKVKLLEAISHRTPVVTTSIGAQGLEKAVVAGGIAVATDRHSIVDETVELLRSPARRQEVSECLQRVCSALETWDDASAAVWRLWRSNLTRRPWP
jgi:glycosyltransferase involved in cell wall biosynthesis